jgi:hypothetical protein
MTTKSSGLVDGNTVSEEVTGVKIIETIPVIKTSYRAGDLIVPIVIKATDKTTHYMHDPGLIHSMDLDTYATEVQPLRIGMRVVPARQPRPIIMQKTHSHLRESNAVEALEDFTGSWVRVDMDTGERYHVTTTQITSGRQLTDHRTWHSATSRVGSGPHLRGEYIAMMQDFTRLDQYTHSYIRKIWIESMIERYGISDELRRRNPYLDKVCRERGIDTHGDNIFIPIVDGRKAHEWILDFWGHVPGAVAMIRSGPDLKSDYIVVRLNMLMSGEFSTRYFNDMTTFAFFLYAEDEMKAFTMHCPLVRVSVQGDDMIEVRHLSSLLQSMSDEECAKFFTDFRKRRAELAEECGLELNELKFVISDFSYEYLKKYGTNGFVIPRVMQAVVGLHESERIDRTEDPLTRMRARISQYRELLFRGYDFETCMRMLYFDWNIIRKIKLNEGESILMPFEALFGKLSGGGIGILPWTIVDPNVDVLIGIQHYPEMTRGILQEWAKSYMNSKASTIGELASQISKDFDKAKKWFETYSDNNVRQLADEAYNKLKELGYDDRFTYSRRAEHSVKETMMDMPQLRKIRIKDKRDTMTAAILSFEKSMKAGVVLDDRLEPIQRLTFVKRETLEPVLDMSPVAGWDDCIAMWANCVGYSSQGNTLSTDTFRDLRRLISRSSIPSNLSANLADAMAKELVENNITEAGNIYQFLISRGAGDKAQEAMKVAENISKRVQELKFVSEVSAYSIVGEGFVDKSISNITRLVSVNGVFNSPQDPVSVLLHMVGFLYLRNQPMYKIEGGELKLNRPSKVLVVPEDEFLRQHLKNLYGRTPLVTMMRVFTPDKNI